MMIDMMTSLLHFTDNADPELETKYIKHLASMSKLKVNQEDYSLSYDGELLDIELPKIDPKDLETQGGLDIECEMRNAILDIVTERFELSDAERDLARCELIVKWRVKWTT